MTFLTRLIEPAGTITVRRIGRWADLDYTFKPLYIHPPSSTIFAKVSSYPVPLDFELERMERTAFQAIARELS
ncbi:MAG: hypothetical protein ACR2PG_19770 [Hyphomicrobiaceae bacterium]